MRNITYFYAHDKSFVQLKVTAELNRLKVFMASNAEYSLEEIKELIAKYCEHRAQGYSKESFIDCDYRTIERHIEEYAADLQPEKREMDKSERKGRFYWEKLGKKIAATGEGNPTAWIFNMKNRFTEWKDKTEVDQNVTGGVVLNFKKANAGS
jgi:DNA-binding transcriptional MerR regulator